MDRFSGTLFPLLHKRRDEALFVHFLRNAVSREEDFSCLCVGRRGKRDEEKQEDTKPIESAEYHDGKTPKDLSGKNDPIVTLF